MNAKKITATLLVSAVGMGGLTACGGSNPLSGFLGSPEKMCSVLEDRKAEFEAQYGKPEDMGVEDLERFSDPAFMQELADANVATMEDLEAAAPNDIKEDATAAVGEAEAFAQLDFNDPAALLSAPETPATERVYQYLEASGCTVTDL